MADRNGHESRLPQTTATVVIIGISQEPQKQTGENKNCSKQQRFDH